MTQPRPIAPKSQDAEPLWRRIHQLSEGVSIPDPLQLVREIPHHLLPAYLDDIQALDWCFEHPNEQDHWVRWVRNEMLYRQLIDRQSPPSSAEALTHFTLNISPERWTLNRIKTPCSFLTDPDDGIISVAVTAIGLQLNHRQIKMNLQQQPVDQPFDYQAATAYFKDKNPLQDPFVPVVELTMIVQFQTLEPITLHLMASKETLAIPIHSWEEYRLWDHYLVQWGLLAPAIS